MIYKCVAEKSCCCSVGKCVWLDSSSWAVAHQAFLSFTISNVIKLMSIGLMMLCNHLILCCPLRLPSIFPSISWLLASGGQSIGASASAAVLTMNIHGWFLLGLTGLSSLLSRGLSRVFSSTTIWKNQLFCVQPSSWSNSQICTWLLEKI